MYATLPELKESMSERILIQLSNDDARATTCNEQVLMTALELASERIDASLRSRYVLPLKDKPSMLNFYCLNLARFWLYSRRAEIKMPETVDKLQKQTLDELSQIANGKLHLGVTEKKEQDDSLKGVAAYKVLGSKSILTEGY